jgi:5-(hydroxymethyl)furfural/furfural oxidase
MGGGSSLMGMIALRGFPGDYDGWKARGGIGWGWDDVLPFFRQLEFDRDFGGPLHGTDGRVPVRRHLPKDWPPFTLAVAQAIENTGYAHIADLNGDFSDGHGPLRMSSTLSSRVTSASAFLDPAVRSRPNLTVQCETWASSALTDILVRQSGSSPTFVQRLDFEGASCIGVSAVHADNPVRYRSTETILAAGAIDSPAVLLRSGIGPRKELERLGIKVLADRPGVGMNLQNHPVVYLGAHIKRCARDNHRRCGRGSIARCV